MNPLFFIPIFFAPEGGGPGGGLGDVGDFGKDMAILNDEPKAEEKPAEKTEKEVETEEIQNDLEVLGKLDDEEKETGEEEERTEEDDDEEDDEEEEKEKPEIKLTGKPSLADIKKEFPDIFKKFPDLKSSFFRDAEFSKHFGTPEDAEQASAKAENYDILESSLLAGSPEIMMKQLAENDPKAFEKVAINWLPQLRALDDKLYVSATEPVLEELIYHAFKYAEKVGDKNLLMSARHMANFVFANGGEIPDIEKKAERKPNPAELQLEKERKEWNQTRLREADSEIVGRITKSLDQVIRQGLDPTNVMSDRTKDAIVKDILDEMNKQLNADKVHGKRMGNLWRKAAQTSYSRQSKESIVTTYLSSAKPLLRELRNRIRAEYLGESYKPGVKPEERTVAKAEKQVVGKRSFEGSNRPVNQSRERSAVLDPKKIDYSKTTDADILNDKVTLKGR